VCDDLNTLAAARADFARARRGQRVASARRRLTRRPGRTRPRALGDLAALYWRPARLRTNPLAEIVGTVDATGDFDAQFRPTTDRVSLRWQRVAGAHRAGRPLPPIAVIERPDGYYVLDGRHRVSVARELGRRAIDAWTSPSPRSPAVPSHVPDHPPRAQRDRAPRRGRRGRDTNRHRSQVTTATRINESRR
jgi:hypothetical protein